MKKLHLLQLILLFCLFSACSPKTVLNQGTGMLPTIKDGDKLLMDENIVELKRGDIIAFLYPRDTSKWYIKRIIGLPGETVEVRTGKIYVNGQILDEPYLDESFNQQIVSFPPKIIGENSYFVLGDNRDNSSDSRYWGSVSKDLIKAKYYTTYSSSNKK